MSGILNHTLFFFSESACCICSYWQTLFEIHSEDIVVGVKFDGQILGAAV
jgi:hypothetical protein